MGIFTGLFKSRDKPQNSYDSPSYTYFFGRANSGKRVMAAGQWLLTEPARRHKPQYAVRLFCR